MRRIFRKKKIVTNQENNIISYPLLSFYPLFLHSPFVFRSPHLPVLSSLSPLSRLLWLADRTLTFDYVFARQGVCWAKYDFSESGNALYCAFWQLFLRYMSCISWFWLCGLFRLLFLKKTCTFCNVGVFFFLFFGRGLHAGFNKISPNLFDIVHVSWNRWCIFYFATLFELSISTYFAFFVL